MFLPRLPMAGVCVLVVLTIGLATTPDAEAGLGTPGAETTYRVLVVPGDLSSFEAFVDEYSFEQAGPSSSTIGLVGGDFSSTEGLDGQYVELDLIVVSFWWAKCRVSPSPPADLSGFRFGGTIMGAGEALTGIGPFMFIGRKTAPTVVAEEGRNLYAK